MGRNQTVRVGLRAATAAAHERVDAIFSRFDLSLKAGYGVFLQAQAAAFLPIERALDAGIAPRLGINWADRRRSDAIVGDLAQLGLPVPAHDDLPPIDRPEAALGTIYVLEGSRLGGALLKRSVAPGLPRAFLAPGDSLSWRALLAALDDALPTEPQQAAAVAAAEAAFARFERAGRAFLPELVR